MSEAAPMIVTEAEREFLAEVLAMWVHEGFTTPPYKPVFYDVAEKLGLQPDPYSYDIRRPADPAARRQAMSTEAAERLREALADALRTLGYPKHLLMDPNHQAAAILSVLVWDRLEAASIDSQVESGTSASSLGRGAPRFAATPPALATERKANEAAERLLALIERGGDRVALRVNANLALAAERKAGAGDERFWIRAAISNLYGGIPEADGDYAIGFDAAKSKALTILDAEAARDA